MGEEGEACQTENDPCGYTVQRHLAKQAAPAGIMKYANYGKGVAFWLDDEEAARFVNGFQEVVSVDNYWFTDPNICSPFEGGTLLEIPRSLTTRECRLAANYGWSVDRVRSLMHPAGSKPVWAFVELGHPSFDPTAPTITTSQIRASVWSSIIHGARGIVYFNHSFAGKCVSHHVLRDCGVELSLSVGDLNQQLHELAPVLNSETVLNGATSAGSVDLLVKRHESGLVVIAASTDHERQEEVSIHVSCAVDGEAEVLGEQRELPVENAMNHRFT